MPRLIRKAPLLLKPYKPVNWGLGDAYAIPAKAPFAWAVLGFGGDKTPHPQATCFPVVIDTGSNQNLSICEETLHKIFGTHDDALKQYLRRKRQKKSNRGQYYNINYDLFLLGTHKRNHKELILEADRSCFVGLMLNDGIQVYPPPKGSQSDNRPNCPVLGMGAIIDNHLRFWTNGNKYSLSDGRILWQFFRDCVCFPMRHST